MGPVSTCPTPEELEQLALGRLPEPRAARCAGHVEQCPRCLAALRDLTVRDPLLEAVSRREGTEPGTPDPGLLPLLDRLSARLASTATTPGPNSTPNPVPRTGEATAAEAPPPGPLLRHPRYRVLGLIGRGGMGAVYRAEHLLMRRTVALKVVGRQLLEKPGSTERFLQEVRAAARLSHPNIVAAYDAEQAGDVHFLVMEHVTGQPLDGVVRERGPLPAAEACDYARQAALGLQHAHEKGMVHRDVKPHNLMRTADGTVKVLDFGLARFLSESGPEKSLTDPGATMGTPDYIAPEQALDAHAADIRADIYALGCTLYHLLAGRPPFPRATAMQTVMAHVNEAPPPLAAARPDVPAALAGVVARMLAKDPAGRYQTPAEVAVALAPFAGQGATAPHAPSPRPRRRGPVVVGALAGAVLAVAATALVVSFYRARPPRPPVAAAPEASPDAATPEPRAVVAPAPHVPPRLELVEIRRLTEHVGQVNAAALSPDGRYALSAGTDPVVHYWDVLARRELRRFETKEAVWCLAFSPDGTRAAAAGSNRVLGNPEVDDASDFDIRVWDLTTGKEVRRLAGHEGPVVCLTFSPDGRSLLSGGYDHTVRRWDLATGGGRVLDTQAATVLGVAVSGDGRHALTGGADGTVWLLDLHDGRRVRRLVGHTDAVRGVALAPDGRLALTGSLDRSVRLWDVETGKEVRSFPGVQTGTNWVAFSPDGRLAAAGSGAVSLGQGASRPATGDHCVRLWDLAGGRELACFRGHASSLRYVAFGPDGRTLLTSSADATVRLLWLAREGPSPAPPVPAGQAELTLARDSERVPVLVTRDDRLATVLVPGKEGASAALEPGDYRLEPGPPEEEHELSVGHVTLAAGETRAVAVRPRRFALELRVSGRVTPPENFLQGAAVSADGRRLLTCGDTSDRVRLWDVAAGKELPFEMRHGAGPTRAVAMSADGTLGVSGGGRAGSTDFALRLWDLSDGKQVGRLTGHTSFVTAVALSADGRHALSGSRDGTVRFWDMPGRRLVRTLEAHRARLQCVALSADACQALAGAVDGSVRRWDLDSGKELRVYEGFRVPVRGVAFSPDGRRVLAGGMDNTMRLWDAETGQELRRFVHPSGVTGVAFTPDGRRALSSSGIRWGSGGSFGPAGRDGCVRLWDLTTGAELARHEVGPSGIWVFGLTPDGRTALAGGGRVVELLAVPE